MTEKQSDNKPCYTTSPEKPGTSGNSGLSGISGKPGTSGSPRYSRKHSPQIRHYADGVASVLRKPVVYTGLRFYMRSEVLYQLTQTFCQHYLPKYGDRTVDQMVQAARSTKQNIAEGSSDGQTSTETELKLLGIARGSNKELLEDYLDYLKANGVRLCVATSLDNSLSFPCLKANKIYDYFEFFEQSADYAGGKSNPQMFTNCAGKLGLNPNEVALFEDVLPSVKAAKQAGLLVVAMEETFSISQADQIKALADMYITSYDGAPRVE